MVEYKPGLEGIPATRSAISFLDGKKGILAYRGYRIEELAEHSSYEETAYLLLRGELPNAAELERFDQELRQTRRVKYNVREIMKYMPLTGHPMEMLIATVAMLGMFYPEPYLSGGSEEDQAYMDAMSLRIIARMATLVSMWEQMRRGNDPFLPRDDLSYAENFLFMMNGRDPDPLFARIMDACLVLHAEHEINASTFSAMVTASTLANPNQVISAAIGTLAGPLHGAANQRVVEMLKDIGGPDKVEDWLDQRLAAKQVIWGMGHREYKVKDPRAIILEKFMDQVADQKSSEIGELFATARALERACADRLGPKGVYPNVDFYSGILYSQMGIPLDQFTPIFAISRTAGWMAHWQEQIQANRIFRPSQIYIGAEQRNYVAIDKR